MATLRLFPILLALLRFAAAGTEAGLPAIRNYPRSEYRLHQQNWAIAQDSRGVIYAANHDGILEFDGVEWRVIPACGVTTVRSLSADGAYVGCQGDFGRLEQGPHGTMRYRSL